MVYRENLLPTGACPRCLAELGPKDEGLGLRACPRCGGVFATVAASTRIVHVLDREMLAFDLRAQAGKERRPDNGMPLRCPECGLEMERNRIESAACDVDACPAHGTWFDAAELSDVSRAFAKLRRQSLPGAVPFGPSPTAAQGAPIPREPEDDPTGAGTLFEIFADILKGAKDLFQRRS